MLDAAVSVRRVSVRIALGRPVLFESPHPSGGRPSNQGRPSWALWLHLSTTPALACAAAAATANAANAALAAAASAAVVAAAALLPVATATVAAATLAAIAHGSGREVYV